MNDSDSPHGFVLSEAALYAFKCQDVFPDVLSFAVAIPDNLKPLFLIPIRMEPAPGRIARSASRIASCRTADGYGPTGETGESELFGTKTFVNDDNRPTVPSSEPGSIFDIEDADSLTHHQEYDFDQNVQVPTDTSYMSDVDVTQFWEYPYRTKEKPVRHSSEAPALILRISMKPEALEPRTPQKIRSNAKACSVKLVSYDKRSRVFTFSVDCGNGAKTVRSSVTDLDHVALSCTCPFWKWNGPEFHAKENDFLLGSPGGTASPPDQKDPDRKYWLCKHAYAVLRRLDGFVQDVVDEDWGTDEEAALEAIDRNWDRLEEEAQVPLEETEEDDADLDVDWEEPLPEDEPEGEASSSEDGSVEIEDEGSSDSEEEPSEEEAFEEDPADEEEDQELPDRVSK